MFDVVGSCTFRVPVVGSSKKVPELGNAFLAVENWARASPMFFMLFWHWTRRPASRAELMAGSSSPTRTPMMLITTSSSMRVKPRRGRGVMSGPFMGLTTASVRILSAYRRLRQYVHALTFCDVPGRSGGLLVTGCWLLVAF